MRSLLLILLASVTTYGRSRAPTVTPTSGDGILVSGSTVNCVPASGVHGGCLTAGAQTISGSKTWPAEAFFQDNIRVSGSYVGSTLQSRIDGEGMTFYGLRAYSQTTSPEFEFISFYGHDGGEGLHTKWTVLNGEVARLDTNGSFYAAERNTVTANSPASFNDSSGVSGHPALGCTAGVGGNYITVRSCNGSNGNSGFHGTLTVTEEGPRDAGGLMLQLLGGFPGPNSIDNSPYVVSAIGEIISYDSALQTTIVAGSYSDVACGMALFGETNNGAGRFAYYSANQTARLCTPSTMDGGSRGETVCTHENRQCGQSGTITLSGGTGTATVAAGSICQCTNQTTENAPKCVVSGATLTASRGASTDVISYHCD